MAPKPRVSKKKMVSIPEPEPEPTQMIVSDANSDKILETTPFYVPSGSYVPSVVERRETSTDAESTVPDPETILYETQQQKERFLDGLKTTIESMNKTNHIEVLKQMDAFGGGGIVKINENRNGVYINLSYLPDPLIRELHVLVHYMKQQERLLNIDEVSKDKLKRDFFMQDAPKQILL